MADGEPEQDAGRGAGKDQPSLELPSLGWRRRRRTPKPEPQAAPQPEPQAAPPRAGSQAARQPEPEAGPQPGLEETRPLVVDEPAPVPEPERVPEPRGARARTERGPGGMPAVLLTGVVVGLGIVGLTWASLRLCESVQGTSSCGDAGYGLLIVILVVMVILGALLLRLARVPEPGSTSFLAVGLTSVLALMFLVDSLMDRPMVVVIPLISAGTFALAHWVTRTFTGSSDT